MVCFNSRLGHAGSGYRKAVWCQPGFSSFCLWASAVKSHGTSQNHKMLEVGMDLCGSSSPTPRPKQGHLEQAAPDLVQAGLEYLHLHKGSVGRVGGEVKHRMQPWSQ